MTRPTPPDPPATRASAHPAPGNTDHHGAAVLSGHLDTRTAAMEVADRLYDAIAGDCHLLVVFASFHHRAAFAEATRHIRQTLTPALTLGATTESVIGVDEEREGRAGLAALALRLPGVELRPWSVTPETPLDLTDTSTLTDRFGVGDDTRAAIMLADPFSTPMNRLLPAFADAAGSSRRVPIVGGMASGASQPGHNLLMFDDRAVAAGAVGVSIGGDVDIDCIVSQGSRPIGGPHVITEVMGQNVISGLGGKPPLELLKETTLELSEDERRLMNRGLLVGIVIDEYKDRFGRGDFLVRNVTGVEKDRGFVAVADRVRVGQTIQFHVRDAETAREDLQLLLDAQQLGDAPFAALLFTCNSRGTRLFPDPNHDLEAVRTRLGNIPVAGFFAAGEIGPVGNQSFVHGHTASVAVFRKRSDRAG